MRNSFILLAAVVFLISCRAPQKKETYLFSVGNTEVPTKEFLYVYKKNNFNEKKEDSTTALKEYLDLFINFKLKVKEAESLGLDTTRAFRNEFEGYRKQLAQPYLTDRKYMDSMIVEAYERLKKEVNASHILIAVAPSASPTDTLKAYKRIVEIRNQAIKGEDFGELARRLSGDSSAQLNKGNLGYFTAMQMVYPFETMAYQTPQGEISKPVRTQFGYHIIKVHDIRPSHGQVKVAHLMLRTSPDDTPQQEAEAKNKIDKLHETLRNGGNWNDLVKQFSEDQNSKNKGGELDWFGVSTITPSFENAAFNLEKGQISNPVKTPYGWHIIKMLDKKPIESFSEMKSTIKSKINNESRSEASTEVFISKLKNDYGFKENSEGLRIAQSLTDSLTSTGNIPQLSVALRNKELFSIETKKYKVEEFYNYLSANSRTSKLSNLYNDFVKEKLLQLEESKLPEKYEDYRMLVKEYREGILLFTLMEENVWSKAVKDTVGLRSFYERNKEKYNSTELADVLIVSFTDSLDMVKTLDSLKLIKKLEDQDLMAISSELNKHNPLRIAIERDTVEKSNENYWEIIPWKKGEYSASINGRHTYFKILDIFNPSNTSLDDVRGQVISDYQKFLEDEWLAELRKKYPVKINEKELKRIGISN